MAYKPLPAVRFDAPGVVRFDLWAEQFERSNARDKLLRDILQEYRLLMTPDDLGVRVLGFRQPGEAFLWEGDVWLCLKTMTKEEWKNTPIVDLHRDPDFRDWVANLIAKQAYINTNSENYRRYCERRQLPAPAEGMVSKRAPNRPGTYWTWESAFEEWREKHDKTGRPVTGEEYDKVVDLLLKVGCKKADAAVEAPPTTRSIKDRLRDQHGFVKPRKPRRPETAILATFRR